MDVWGFDVVKSGMGTSHMARQELLSERTVCMRRLPSYGGLQTKLANFIPGRDDAMGMSKQPRGNGFEMLRKLLRMTGFGWLLAVMGCTEVTAQTPLNPADPTWKFNPAPDPATPVAVPNAKATAGVDKVIVVFKTHFDIGYTALASEVIDHYRTDMIDRALDTISQSASLPRENQFAWTLPGWPLTQVLWDGQDPVRRKRIEEAIKADKITWHALACTTETESLDLEDLAHSFVFSVNLSKKYGKPLPRSGKMTDVPEHAWAVPTLLTHAGIKFLHIGSNDQCLPPNVPDLFWWEGPDGSRLLTFFTKCAYGTGVIPPKDWPFKSWLAMQMTGDNHGPPTPQEVQQILNTAQSGLPGVKIKFGTMDDFYDAIRREDLSKLPIIRGDMTDTWIHGTGAMPVETALARNIRPAISTLEILDSLLAGDQLKPGDIRPLISEAYERSLMYGEHTWGLHGEAGPRVFGDEWKQALAAGAFKRMDASFDQHRAYIRRVAELIDPALAGRMELLAQNVTGDGSRIVVFNPLPWSRSALVRTGPQAVFVAKNLPPCGYATYPLPDAAKVTPIPADAKVIENTFFRVTVDPARGGIGSIIDKASGRELVAQHGDAALGQYMLEKFSAKDVDQYNFDYGTLAIGRNRKQEMGKPGMPPDAVHSVTCAGNGTSVASRDESGTVIELKMPPSGKNPDPVSLRIHLYDELPFIDLEWSVSNKTPDRIPEGGWLCLPFDIRKPTWKLGRLGTPVDPARDIVEGSNFQLFCLTTGLSVRDADGFGVGICPLDSPLVSLGQPGLWKYTRQWTERKAQVYVSLFNNQWNTNFPLWIDGSWRSRVRLWVLGRNTTDWDMTRTSWEARTACPAVRTTGQGGKLPPTQSRLSLSRAGVLVTSLGPNPDGRGTLLRVWEQAGTGAELVVSGLNARTATPVNLRGEITGAPLTLVAGKLTFILPAYAPASFILNSP